MIHCWHFSRTLSMAGWEVETCCHCGRIRRWRVDREELWDTEIGDFVVDARDGDVVRIEGEALACEEMVLT